MMNFSEIFEIFRCKIKAGMVRRPACEKMRQPEKKELEDLFRTVDMNFVRLNADISKISFYWSRSLAEMEICAFWTPRDLNCVFLNLNHRNALAWIVPTIAHELVHRKQFLRYGLLYFIMNIPILSEFLLEKDARRAETLAQEFLNLSSLQVKGNDIL